MKTRLLSHTGHTPEPHPRPIHIVPDDFTSFFRNELHFYASILAHPDTKHTLRQQSSLQNLVNEYNLIMPSFRIPVPIHTLSPQLQLLWRVHIMYGGNTYFSDIQRQYGDGCDPQLTHVVDPIHYNPEVKEDVERSFADVDLYSATLDVVSHLEYIFEKFLDLPANIRGIEQMVAELHFWRSQSTSRSACDERVCQFVDRIARFHCALQSFSPNEDVRIVVQPDDEKQAHHPPPALDRLLNAFKSNSTNRSRCLGGNGLMVLIVACLVLLLIFVMVQPSVVGGMHLNEFIPRRGSGQPPPPSGSWRDMGKHRRRLQADVLTDVTIVLAVVLTLCATLVLVIFLCACCRAGDDNGPGMACDCEEACGADAGD